MLAESPAATSSASIAVELWVKQASSDGDPSDEADDDGGKDELESDDPVSESGDTALSEDASSPSACDAEALTSAKASAR